MALCSDDCHTRTRPGLSTLYERKRAVVQADNLVSSLRFHQPQLTAIMPVLGSTFFILSLSSTHYALAMRGMDFRSRTVAELVDGFVRGAVGITLALAGA